MEHEKFLFNSQNNKRIDYQKIKDMFSTLLEFGWNPVLEKNNIIGLNGTAQTYWSVEYIPELRTARFGTYGRGIWDFILDENFEILLGDLNQDTIINIQDIIILINISLTEIIPTEYQNLAGDNNQDETIDILDIINCINIILNR